MRAGISRPLFYGNILHIARKARYSPNKLTKPLNRLIPKGYSYGIVFKSLRMAFLLVLTLIRSLGLYIDFKTLHLKAVFGITRVVSLLYDL